MQGLYDRLRQEPVTPTPRLTMEDLQAGITELYVHKKDPDQTDIYQVVFTLENMDDEQFVNFMNSAMNSKLYNLVLTGGMAAFIRFRDRCRRLDIILPK